MLALTVKLVTLRYGILDSRHQQLGGNAMLLNNG